MYALKSEPDKSQEFLNKVTPSFAINICNTYPEMKFWIAESIHFNTQNGLKDAQKFSRLLKDAGAKSNKKNPDLPNNKGLPQRSKGKPFDNHHVQKFTSNPRLHLQSFCLVACLPMTSSLPWNWSSLI